MEALSVEGLGKHFGALQVLREVSFRIAAEEKRVVIIGPNGAGKTTLFNLISGELQSSAGAIHLFGKEVTRVPCFRRMRLGLARTFQVTDLFPYFTLMQNLLLAFQAHDSCCYQMVRPLTRYRHLYEKAEALLRRMKLWEKRDDPITSLSYGEARLVELMLGIAGNPKLLLLDEPTAGITRSESLWLTSIIKEILTDVTLLIIEHDMNIAFDLAERILVLHQGEIIADGDPAAIRGNRKVKEIYLGTHG